MVQYQLLSDLEFCSGFPRSACSGSSRDLSSRLEFPLHLPSRQAHQDSFRVSFFFVVYIAWPLLLVALSSSVGSLVVLDLVHSLWWNMGIQLGRSQPRAGLVGKHSRDQTSLSQTSCLPQMKGKRETGVETPLPACHAAVENVSPAMSRKSSMVSWSDSPREQSEANGEDTVMEDGTETHQAEINKKVKANDKLRNFLTNMPEEHRTLIYGDSFKSRMESLDDEKAALLAAKRQLLPLQSRIDKQKNYLERVSKEIESKQKKRLEILQKWIEADQELEAANAEQMQAKQEMALLVAPQPLLSSLAERRSKAHWKET